MKFTLLLPILFCLNAAAQDTLVLTPSMAVSMALENNIESVNSLLRVSGAETSLRLSWFQAEPAEITYRSGQLYSDQNSDYLHISQNLSSVPEYRLNIKMARAGLAKTTAEAEIIRKDITIAVKSAYYTWIYYNNLVRLMSDKQKYLTALTIYEDVENDSGYFDPGQFHYLESLYAEAETELVCSIADMEIAANNLRMLIMSNKELIPGLNSLPLYQVERLSDTAVYSGSSLISYYREILNVSTINTQLQKSAFFPEIKVGVINQQIKPFNNLWAWQVGINIPLLFPKEAANVKKAANQQQISRNNLENIVFKTEKEIENLLIELDKYFRRIILFDRYTLPDAENDEKTAADAFQNKQLPLTEYLNIMANSHKVKTEYLKMVNDYNQTAIKLEYYIN